MSNQTAITVGSKITTRQEYPAYIVEGVKVFGYLPAGAVGEVIGHTADGRARISFDGEIHTFESLDNLTVELANRRWTDESIQAMTIFIEHGDNLEWLGDESAEVVMLEDVIRMRDDLTAQLAAAHQRIAELEQRAAEWKPASGYYEDAEGDSVKLYIDDRLLSLFASGESMAFALPDELRLVQQEGSQG